MSTAVHSLCGALVLTGLCCYKQTWQRLTLAAAFMNIYNLSGVWPHIRYWRMFYSKDDNLSHTNQTQHSIDAWLKCATVAWSMFASKWILMLASTLVLTNHYRCFAAHSPGLFFGVYHTKRKQNEPTAAHKSLNKTPFWAVQWCLQGFHWNIKCLVQKYVFWNTSLVWYWPIGC